MIDVSREGVFPTIGTLDASARGALGGVCSGVSVNANGATIHLLDSATSGDVALATNVLNAALSLEVATDKATITADDSDTATISCNDPAIGGDANVNFYVWLGNELYASGTAPVTAGVVELTLKTDVEGVYRVDIVRQSGTRASGGVTITAVEE